jgi:hypothetical protein
MAISTLCLLQTPKPSSSPPHPRHVVKLEQLDDALLLHTDLDFAEEPEALAAALREALGEDLARQHQDARGVFLIPSIAGPRARSYAAVIEEVGEGGVWAAWLPPLAAGAAGGHGAAPGLDQLFTQMLGQMPDSLAAAASSLRADPNAMRAASQQLPGLLGDPGELAQLMSGVQEQLPQLADMLRGMGIDVTSPEFQAMSRDLGAQLAQDPGRLAKLAETLFAEGHDAHEDEDEDED